MKTFKSTINNKSASFRSNKESMMELVDKLNSFLKISNIQGNEIALKRAKDRGKTLTREKLWQL